MRLRHALMIALLCAAPLAAPAAANDPPPRTDPAPRGRMTTEQRFEAANTTRDGQLTLEQARIGYKTVARHFDTIDATGKGFVTLEDIRAWQRANRAARQAARAAAEDPLRPRTAMQRQPGDRPPLPQPTQVMGPKHDVIAADDEEER